MARKSRNTAISIAIQSVRDTFTAPNTTTDLLSLVSNCRMQQDGITIADDSYTGSVFQNADAIAGKRVTLTFTVKIKPPSSLPAANAYVPGRIFQAAKMTELRNSATIPAGGAEALGAWTDSKNPTLGATASSTAGLYDAYPIQIGAAAYKSKTTAIRRHGAAKAVSLMEDWGSTPATNYLIPTFLMYARDVTSADPAILSIKAWLDGHRYDLVNCGVTGLRYVLPTSTKDQAAFCTFEVTLDCTIYANAEEATPSIAAVGPPPLAKDGKEWLNYVKQGVASVTVDMGLTAENPPNMNQPDGADAPELSGGSARASLTKQKYLPSVIDVQAMADAQSYYPYFKQWGNSAWNMVQVLVPDARLNFPNPDLSGGIIMENVDLFIDVLNRNFVITFPGA